MIVNLKYVSAIAWTGLVTVSAALIYAFGKGHPAADWPRLVSNPLGVATLVDVYAGFALFSCWIAWREARSGVALLWIAMILVGGNLVTAVYVLLALRASDGVAESFWRGTQSRELQDGG